MSNKNFGFSKFSQNDFYNNVNKKLINSLDIKSNQKIVDLGCGSGGITNLRCFFFIINFFYFN